MNSSFDSALLPPQIQIQLKAVKDRLDTYVETMAPGKVLTNAEGVFQQTQLWQGVLKPLLLMPPEAFVVGWSSLLDVVAEHRRTVFSPAYVNRFREEIKLTTGDRRNLERLLHLVTVTAERRTRALAMKQIDLNLILAGLPTEDQRQKILGFYEA